jgi:hypothetical protein
VVTVETVVVVVEVDVVDVVDEVVVIVVVVVVVVVVGNSYGDVVVVEYTGYTPVQSFGPASPSGTIVIRTVGSFVPSNQSNSASNSAPLCLA